MSSEESKFCPFCGSGVKIDDTFCNNCGASLEEVDEPVPAAPVQQPTDFSYTETQPTVAVTTKKPETTYISYLSLVAGIASIILTLLPYSFYTGAITAVAAIICGGVGYYKENKKNIAIIGLILGILGAALFVIDMLNIIPFL